MPETMRTHVHQLFQIGLQPGETEGCRRVFGKLRHHCPLPLLSILPLEVRSRSESSPGVKQKPGALPLGCREDYPSTLDHKLVFCRLLAEKPQVVSKMDVVISEVAIRGEGGGTFSHHSAYWPSVQWACSNWWPGVSSGPALILKYTPDFVQHPLTVFSALRVCTVSGATFDVSRHSVNMLCNVVTSLLTFCRWLGYCQSVLVCRKKWFDSCKHRFRNLSIWLCACW